MAHPFAQSRIECAARAQDPRTIFWRGADRKCRQAGVIYSCEEVSKGKIWMPIQPSALMILSYVPGQNFWTVVSLYFHEGALDGEIPGRYTDTMDAAPAIPTFSIRDLPPSPKILFKAKRRLQVT